jgi:hypothetical protein
VGSQCPDACECIAQDGNPCPRCVKFRNH